MAELTGKRIAVLAAKGVEQVELEGPRKAVEAAGATTSLLSVPDGVEDGAVQAVTGDIRPSTTFPVDALVGDVSPDDYDGLLLPGGAVNPDTLRQDDDALAFVKAFMDAGKPVAAICHAPWTLIEADVVRGRRMTSFGSLATDLRNAGAEWVDEEVVVDDGIITSRTPDDLPAFCRTLVEEFAKDITPAHALEG
jgi:protease I